MIGARFREARKRAGYTQEQLAKLLGVTRDTIYNYEAEFTSPNDRLKIDIAKYLNVCLDYLIGVSDDFSTVQKTEPEEVFKITEEKQTKKKINSRKV